MCSASAPNNKRPCALRKTLRDQRLLDDGASRSVRAWRSKPRRPLGFAVAASGRRRRFEIRQRRRPALRALDIDERPGSGLYGAQMTSGDQFVRARAPHAIGGAKGSNGHKARHGGFSPAEVCRVFAEARDEAPGIQREKKALIVVAEGFFIALDQTADFGLVAPAAADATLLHEQFCCGGRR